MNYSEITNIRTKGGHAGKALTFDHIALEHWVCSNRIILKIKNICSSIKSLSTMIIVIHEKIHPQKKKHK